MSLMSVTVGKFKTLLHALSGNVLALAEVVTDFGSDRHFMFLPAPVNTTLEDTWVLVQEDTFPIDGGIYWVDFLVFFTGTETNRAYEIRALVNGTPTGDIISKELKDVADEIEYNTFNEFGFPRTDITVRIEMRIPAGGGTPSMTVDRYRLRVYRVAES